MGDYRITDMSEVLFIVLLTLFSCCYGNLNSNCQGNTTSCEPLEYFTCLGIALPYESTSLQFANDSNSQKEVQEKLTLWSGLQNVPQCWAVIQPVLCAVYMPKCNGTTVEMPSQEMCEKIQEPCKIVESTRGWPSFLRCNAPHFVENCATSNPASKLQFNTSATCEKPLVKTSNPDSYYEDVAGCGIQCENPLFTTDEHTSTHIFIAVAATLCVLCTLFALVTFLIDWKNAHKYPAMILFFINACFFIGSIGWLAQFMPGAREDIVCRADGTMRIHEPQIGSGESASCAVIFIIVYFTLMAGIAWFVILAFCWHLTFKALGTPQDVMEGKISYFHIAAWSFPLVLTIICMATSQVDGDSLSGICLVGNLDHKARAGLVLAPVGIVIIIGGIFMSSGLHALCKLRRESPGFISDRATTKIRNTILRLGLFGGFALSFVVITFVVHVYIFVNAAEWEQSFKDYVICEANVVVAKAVSNTTMTCSISSRPSLVAVQMNIFAYFGAGIVMSSWVWTKPTLEAWKRFLGKCFRITSNKPVKLKKHKMVAQAFAQRREMNNGRLSISFHSTHDDPMGMKFDLNSVTSHDMSSAFHANLHKLVRRRGGMIHPVAGTLRRYSDSDVQSLKSFSQQLQARVEQQQEMQQQQEDSNKRKKKKKKKRGKGRVAPLQIPESFLAAHGGLIHSRRRGSNGRRGSNTSVLTNQSAHSIAISVNAGGQLSSDSEAMGSKPQFPQGKRGSKGSVDINHVMGYSMFTASSYVPNMGMHLQDLEQTDNEIEKQCKPKQNTHNQKTAFGRQKNSAGKTKPAKLTVPPAGLPNQIDSASDIESIHPIQGAKMGFVNPAFYPEGTMGALGYGFEQEGDQGGKKREGKDRSKLYPPSVVLEVGQDSDADKSSS
ncbi:unnamed protein product [Owenia fusiformis]|uniref:Protein smoothened n=1 Tax=Owenia fusiformis TaxID=6347 RepID=A0A8J1Y0D7_OWEFU|nr:unnamed protein product [Owenia fusiformis]